MKKKIKDLTEEETNNICNKYSLYQCSKCPLYNDNVPCNITAKLTKYLEKEVEVEEDEK